MFKNYVKIAWRNLLRRKVYALLNAVGLAVGLTFTLLIGRYVWGELQVNGHLRNAEQQYIVQSRWKVPEMGNAIGTLAPFGPTLKRLYPHLIANYYRNYGVNAIVTGNNQHFREGILVGDATLLTMFGFPIAHGNVRTAFREPNSVVITAALAQKYFGRTDVVQKQLTIQTPVGGKQLFTITGVLGNVPENSITQQPGYAPQLYVAMSSYGYFADKAGLLSWENQTIMTYLELQPGVSSEQLPRLFAQTLKTYAPPAIRANWQAYLIPLSSYHLEANNGVVSQLLLTLSLATLFILLMAIINFVNLTTGLSASRLQEIGIRKALGGLRTQLVSQFLVEALLLTGGAVVLALIGYEACRPMVSTLLDKPIAPLWHWSPAAFAGLMGLLLVVSLLAGAYPAFVLSRQHMVEALKSQLRSRQRATPISFGRVLTILQFTVASFVFVGALLINRQVSYFLATDLGYQKNQVITVNSVPRNWSREGVSRLENVRDQLVRIPGVAEVSLSFEIPDGSSSGSVSMFPLGRDSTQAITASSITSDERFARTYGLTLKAGQFFHAGNQAYDSSRVVLNESAAKALGWTQPDKALGQLIRFRGEIFRVGGIVANFHFGSLREAISPLVFIPVRKDPIYRYLSFRIEPGRLPETVAAIRQHWTGVFSDAPFDYKFMDDTIGHFYQTERQLQKASQLATGLALLIVLLGVVGLVSLSVARRTREVGIRKVLGASVASIMSLFLGEYVWVMGIANAVAWPLAYWLISEWLAGYAYHTAIGWLPFVGVGVLLALLTGLVVSSQVIRTALLNPVESLRNK